MTLRPLPALFALAALPAAAAAPGLQRFTLPNGLTVVLQEDHDRALVRARLELDLDARELPAGKAGLPAFLLRALRRGGAGHRDGAGFERTLDAAGIELREAQEGPRLAWELVARSRDQELAFGLLADLVLRPAFDGPALEVARRRMTAEEQGRTPSERAAATFLWRLSGSPAWEEPPSDSSVGTLSQADLAAFHERAFQPGRARLALYGDLTLAQARQLALLTLGTWSPRERPLPIPAPAPAPAPGEAPRLALAAESGGGARLRLGFVPPQPALDPAARALLTVLAPGVAPDDPPPPGLLSLDAALPSDPEGPFLLEAQVEPGLPLAPLRDRLAAGLQAWAARGFAEADLARAKTAWRGRQASLGLRPDQRLRQLLGGLRGTLPSAAEIEAVDLDRLNAALRRLLDPKGLRVLAQGDATALRGLAAPEPPKRK